MVGVQPKRKRKKVNDSSESDGAADSASDNEWCDDTDYLAFLNEFLKDPAQTNSILTENDDEEADPEYNLEDEEDDHDSEELRRDPAVKISKKELTELLADPFVGKQDQSVQAFQEESDVQQGMEQQIEEPLFSERVTGMIKYQLQQHIQLLSQTYVLTTTCSEESMKILAKESKAMIVELFNFAEMNGPKSTFAVKNASHAKDLINSWPVNVMYKSPIKKKILEERYMNENKIEGDDTSLFPRNIVKVISECPVFMYSELLPLTASLQSKCKVNFTVNEDALIVIGLHEMENEKYESLNLNEKAQLVNTCLLPGRPVSQIFHRIKNARKAFIKEESAINCNLRKYLLDKSLPPSPMAKWTLNLLELEPIPPINHPKLPVSWCSLIKKLRLGFTVKDYFKAQKIEGRRPPRKSSKKLTEGQEKVMKKRSIKKRKKNQDLVENSSNESVNESSIEEPHQRTEYDFTDTERIPVLNILGKPAAYIVIPKGYTQQVKNSTPTPSSVSDQSESPSELSPCNENDTSSSEIVAVPVGKPFSMPSLDGENADCLDVCSFESPLKREIFQKASSTSRREDHCARTWIYGRKSLAEIAASIEKNLECNESESPNYSDDENDPSNEIYEATFEGEEEYEMNCEESKENETSRDDDDIQPPPTSNFQVSSPECSNSRSPVIVKTSTPIKPVVQSTTPVTTPTPVKPVNEQVHTPTIVAETDTDKNSSPEKSIMDNDINVTMDSNNNPSDKGDKGGTQKASGSGEGKPGNGTSAGKTKSAGKGPDKTSTGRQAGSSDGRGNDDEDNDRRRKLNRSLRSKEDDTDHKEDDSDEDDDSPPPRVSPNSSKITINKERKTDVPTSKKAKKLKRSPGSNAKKRTTKYNTTEMQKLLDDADSEVDIGQIQTAFAEEFWLKLQHTVDPVLYNNIVQIFVDHGDKGGSEEEFFAKVGDSLKDHPELLLDFVTMVEPESPEIYSFFKDIFKDNFQCQVQIRFMYLLEKLTVQCPQLKARVLQKLRYLREIDKLRESDVMEVIELYFQGNSVMTDAFKALFPTIFRPETNVRTEDFEEINLDDDTLEKSEEGTAVEVINFPEESTIPATNSCSCECHLDTRNVSYTTKAKHCRKCCIKFQDGKVFMHSGRMMKQVNVEFTTKEKAEEILSGSACAHCLETFKVPEIKTKNKKSTTVQSRTKAKVQSGDSSSINNNVADINKSVATTKGKSTESSTTTVLNNPESEKNNVGNGAEVVKPIIVTEKAEDLEEGEILDDDEVTANNNSSDNMKESSCRSSNSPPPSTPSTSGRDSNNQNETNPWTMDEDRTILLSVQQEQSMDSAFEKIVKSIPTRTLLEIRTRFSELIAILQRVRGVNDPELQKTDPV